MIIYAVIVKVIIKEFKQRKRKYFKQYAIAGKLCVRIIEDITHIPTDEGRLDHIGRLLEMDHLEKYRFITMMNKLRDKNQNKNKDRNITDKVLEIWFNNTWNHHTIQI